ncbi:MAG: undecaprenyl-phosphate glucose phosphotransferase [Bdellovibrionaceae bacterium]|nr:undecaprenyl-phosphate glucose phosphotransferase [Pseudobdellovibrionaceae bacterium]
MQSNDVLRENESALILLVRAADTAVMVATGAIAYFLYFETLELPPHYKTALVLAGALALIVFPLFGLYRSWRGRHWHEQLRSLVFSVLMVLSILVIASAIMKTTAWYSRVWFGSWALSSIAALFLLKRFSIYVLRELRGRGWNNKNIAIYGAGELGQLVAERLQTTDWAGFKIIAFLDDDVDSTKLSPALSSIPVLKAPADLESFISKSDIRELWIALPLRAEVRVREILFALRHSTVQIRFVPNIFSFNLLLGHAISDVAGIPVVDINVTPIAGINRIIKALEDRVLAAIILLLISPIMAVIAIAIRLESKGPALYKQERHGWDGRVIKVYKFRSMRALESANEVRQATKNDPRVTRVGSFIRRTSLDELPQFFNVLQGRMSIVGPRPHPVKLNDYYKDKVDFYFQRHKVKPGITGWAQINGYRGETDTIEKMERRIQLDLQYIQNWSVWLDLKIIVLTIFKGFRDTKAY